MSKDKDMRGLLVRAIGALSAGEYHANQMGNFDAAVRIHQSLDEVLAAVAEIDAAPPAQADPAASIEVMLSAASMADEAVEHIGRGHLLSARVAAASARNRLREHVEELRQGEGSL